MDAENAAKRVASYSEKLLHHASILSEKEYQKFLLERLEKDNGYVIRKASNFDRYFAVDREMEHKAGLIRVMDDKCNSADLAIALNGNTKIIATTIQKFPYIVDSVKGLTN